MTCLLHSCCGPCASACVPRLKELGHSVAMYFANSNIDTREEFEKRLAAARKLAAAEGVELFTEPYDHEEWLREVAAGYEDEPEKGARCERCFRYNLAKTAAFASAHGFDAFTTSLTVSPHKVSEKVFAAGRAAATVQTPGLTASHPLTPSPSHPLTPSPSHLLTFFLEENFKKREGFKLSLERSAALGLYRQSYCGCEFSRKDSR